MIRNLVVVLCGAVTSAMVAATVLYLEARSGETLFSFTVLRYIPLGAIVAGFIGSLGFMGGSLALRLRPAMADLFAFLAIAAAVVFLVQSADFSLFIGGEDRAYAATKDMKGFGKFLGASLVHTPLHFWSGEDGNEDAATVAFFAPGYSPNAPHVASAGDAKADEIGNGVTGIIATQDVRQTGAGKQVTQMTQGFQALGAKMHTHGAEWLLFVTQTIGFMVGGVLVFSQLRAISHCKDCMLLMTSKGQRTRYFARSKEMRTAVDEVLTKARDKQLQQSIQAHVAKGSEQGGNWTEFCSTLEIQRCTDCRTHKFLYSAKRKDGAAWKEIGVFGFTTTTLEPIDFA
jgi:hypothetical protein